MASIGAMIKQIEGLAGTADTTDWEDEFIESIVAKTSSGKSTERLSTKQLEHIEKIYNKHFAG